MSQGNSVHLLEVRNLGVSYGSRPLLFWRKKTKILDNISFVLDKGQTLVLAGDAGSGKSTLLNLLSDSRMKHRGDILVYGKPYRDYERRDRVKFIRSLSSDYLNSVNPHKKVNFILDQPLKINTDYSAEQRAVRIDRMIEYVGLTPDTKYYYPGHLTHNQLMRLSIAKALIVEPEILLVDSFIAKLDAQLRAHCLNLFMAVQRDHNMSLIICINDIGLIKHIADKILVLSHGRQIDYGNAKAIVAYPDKEMTKRLIQDYNNEYRVRLGK